MQAEKRNIFLKGAIHLLVWTVFFTYPYFVFPRQPNDFNKLITHNWFPLFEYAITFYLNYFLLLNRHLFQKKYLLFFLLNALLIAVLVYISFWFRDVCVKPDIINQMPPPPDFVGRGGRLKHMQPRGLFFILKDVFSFMVPVIFSIAVRATENWIKSEAEKKEIVNRNLETELAHLHYQLQPHFFFNSLNNIYALIELSPAKAQEAVHSLSKLMRYLLYDTSRERVNLKDEVEFMKKYIQLMELRQTGKTTTHFNFPEVANGACYIAPLLFIPMIENAYKHGVSATKASFISFDLEKKNNHLLFYSENSNFPKTSADKSGSGIGLENLKKRLELLYPGKYVLENGLKDDVYWIRLDIEID